MTAERRIDPDYIEPPLTRADIELVIQRSLQYAQPQVSYQQNGYKLASILLGILVTISMAISAWTLSAVVQLRDDMAVLKCQMSEACKHAVLRGSS